MTMSKRSTGAWAVCTLAAFSGVLFAEERIDYAAIAKIRKSIPPARPYGTQSDNWRVTHRGPSQDRAFEDMCRDGSRKLLEAYARYYQRNVAA